VSRRSCITAKQLAAALGFIGLVNLDRVVIEAFNNKLTHMMPPMRGRKSLWRMLTFLDKIDFRRRRRSARIAADVQSEVQGQGHRRRPQRLPRQGWLRGCAALSRRPATRRVRHSDSVAGRDQPEIVGDLRLVDVESEDTAEITVSGPLLRRYKQNLAAFRAALHDFCTRRGASCLFTSNQVPSTSSC